MPNLERICLINAAAFDYLEFPVGQHGQVIGANGHGKSTLLRATLFFYLGTNEKRPYALPETKRDFMSHYLGDIPSYLIYEVARGGGKPSYHIAVTRPGRVQFHFVDAPYSRDYYRDGNVVNPIETVHDRLRDAGCHFEVFHSYDDFIGRIYGLIPSPYTVFRPATRNTAGIAVLPRIISGIFTVSQLDADKLKAALTCGVRKETLSTELDLTLLQVQLEKFRRVNRAVKTYLDHEQQAISLVELAGDYERVDGERRRTIEELVRMAKRLPDEEKRIAAETQHLNEEEAADNKQFAEIEERFDAAIRAIEAEITTLTLQISTGETALKEYGEKGIEEKAKELQSLGMWSEKATAAQREYNALTAVYKDENTRRQQMIDTEENRWSAAKAGFQERIAQSEAKAREDADTLGGERQEAQTRIEQERHQSKESLRPRKEQVGRDRKAYNADIKEHGATRTPKELSVIEQKRDDAGRTKQTEQVTQATLRGKIAMAKQKADSERERREREAKAERERIDALQRDAIRDRDRLRDDIAAFDASLARFYQEKAPQEWDAAVKTLNRDTLFASASDLGAKAAPAEPKGVWGVDFQTEGLPAPNETYDRDELDARHRLKLKEIAEYNDKATGLETRFKEAATLAAKQATGEIDELQRQLNTSIENWGKASERYELHNNEAINLRSQFEQHRAAQQAKLDQRDAAITRDENDCLEQERQIENRFTQRNAEAVQEFDRRKEELSKASNDRRNGILAEEQMGLAEHSAELVRIDSVFQAAISGKGVSADVIEAASARLRLANENVNRISAFQSEVAIYTDKKRDWIDPLPSRRSQREGRCAEKDGQTCQRDKHRATHDDILAQFKQRRTVIIEAEAAIKADKSAYASFLKDERFVQELGYPDREDLPPAALYRPRGVCDSLTAAGNAHTQRETTDADGNKQARHFLGRFDPVTLEQRLLGFSPILETHFNWYLFVGGELKPFVDNNRIKAMTRVQTEQFTQLVRNIRSRNADFREGVRQVNQTAEALQAHLQQYNFVDVIDSIEFKVGRLDNNLTRTLSTIEGFENLDFGNDHDLFATQADSNQTKRAIEAFGELLKEIDAFEKDRLLLTDFFEFSIRVSENGHDMGWRRSLDHIGSTGTDYLLKMLIYLSLIEVYRERAIESGNDSAVHCILDETGILAGKYVRDVLAYASSRGIILLTAGHSTQPTGFNNSILVRKFGNRFGGQTVLRKVLKCDPRATTHPDHVPGAGLPVEASATAK